MKMYENIDFGASGTRPYCTVSNRTHDATPQQVFGDCGREGQELREPDVFQVIHYDVAMDGFFPELQVQRSYGRLTEQRHVETIVVRRGDGPDACHAVAFRRQFRKQAKPPAAMSSLELMWRSLEPGKYKTGGDWR